MAIPGSRDAKRNKLLISPFPLNLKRLSTYAIIEPVRIEPASTNTRMIKEFLKATPMFACFHAWIKFSTYVQLLGSVITLVEAYSSGLLNAVITHTTSGSIDTNAPRIKVKYFNTTRIPFFNFAAVISVRPLSLP